MTLYSTLRTFAQLSFEFGVIDFTEYLERIAVANWIADQSDAIGDPRGEMCEGEKYLGKSFSLGSENTKIIVRPTDASDWLELVVLGSWYFTGSDPDSYASVPHGHLHSVNRPWPKLNPYTGRVFAAKHQEDISLRLTKRRMQELWRSESFRDFCRLHIMRYAEQHPNYNFGVRRKLRFPRW